MAIKDNVQGVVLALFGASAGGHLAGLTATATASSVTALATDLASSAGFILGRDLSTAAAFRDNMLTGLGIPSTNSAYAAAAEWANGELAKPNANRGEIVASAVAYLAGLTDTASPFYAAASAYRTTVAAAVAWSEGAGATVFGVAELQAQQGSSGGAVGDTFTLTSADDDLAGTADNDTFNAASVHISADDVIDGGAGEDTLNVTLTGDVAALTAENIETVNLVVKAFADKSVDLANISGAEVNVSQFTSGFATSLTINNDGGATVNVGSGIKTLVLGQYGEGTVKTGGLTSLTTNGDGVAADIVLQGSSDLTWASGADIVGATITTDAARTVLVTGDQVFSGDLILDGAVTVDIDTDMIADGGTITGAAATLRLGTSTDTSVDLVDVDVATIALYNTTGTTFSNAEDKNLKITKAGATLTADTSTDGGELTVGVEALASTVTVAAANADVANATFASAVKTSTGLAAGAVTNISVGHATEMTFTALTEADTATVVNLTGAATKTVITSSALTSLNASEYTGNITVSHAATGSASMTTGVGNDKITIAAAAEDQAMIFDTGAGNDEIDFSLVDDGSAYASTGAGDDKFTFGTAAQALAAGATGSTVLDGGDGVDTFASYAAYDYTTMAGLVLNNIEAITMAGNTSFKASTVSGKTMSITAKPAASEGLTIVTGDTTTSLDLSGLTLATTVDSLAVTLTDTDDGYAFTYTGSARGETVAGTTDSKSFTMDLGAGNDTLTLAVANGDDALEGGTVTLGAGTDTVVVIAKSSLSTTGETVSITDFVTADDELDMVGAIHANIISSAGSDVSASSTGTATDITGYVKDGMVKLAGADAGQIDSLSEWISVVDKIDTDDATNATAFTYGFEFAGDTYVAVYIDGVQDAFIKLVGVTGATLGTGEGANVISIS